MRGGLRVKAYYYMLGIKPEPGTGDGIDSVQTMAPIESSLRTYKYV